MFNLFIKGGPIMIVLFFCSAVVVYIIVERFLFLKEQTVDVRDILSKIKDSLQKNCYPVFPYCFHL